jgi:hypothetical protein
VRPLRSRYRVWALAAHWKARYNRKTRSATRTKGPCLLTDLNATRSGGAHGPLRSSYRICSLAAHWKERYSRKTSWATRAKGPCLLTDLKSH